MRIRGRYIGFLLAVIAIAVGSVVVAQVYWIQNAFELEEKNFRFNAQQALDETSRFIESNYGCFEVSNKIVLGEGEDLLILHRHGDINEPHRLDTIRQYSTSFSEDSMTAINFTAPFPLTSEIHIKYHYTPLEPAAGLEEQNLHNTLKQIHKQEQDKIFSGTYPVTYVYGEKFFRSYIDSILKFHLQDKNIHSPYQFLLKDERSDTILLKNFSASKMDESKSLSASLYSNSYFFSPQEIYLWIPNDKKHLIGKMRFLLVGSFLVLLLLGWGTVAMAKALLRQKRLSEMKTDFINNMTHEFKTPSANIGLAVETIDNLNMAGGHTKLKKYLRLIGTENSRMQNNIERILQASLLDQEPLSLDIEKIHIDEILKQVIDSFNVFLKDVNGSIDLYLNTEKTIIYGDQTHISNVFYNLIDNAVKFNHNAPKISIVIGSHPTGLEVLVEDNGIGIPQEEQQKIFSSFYRVPAGNTHDVQGFGLGLSYVKAVVEAHGGNISLQSTVGKGSLFKIILPHNPATKAPAGSAYRDRQKRRSW